MSETVFGRLRNLPKVTDVVKQQAACEPRQAGSGDYAVTSTTGLTSQSVQASPPTEDLV